MAQAEASAAQFSSSALYVGDLDPNATEEQIFQIFNAVARVVSVRVCRDKLTKRSLGYAYVNFSNSQDASVALEKLQFTSVNGKPVRVMLSSRDPSSRRSGTGNIFVKNLDKSIDNKALHDLFSPYGKIMSCKVAVDAGNVSKGFGFVQFEAEESAHQAIEQVNGTAHMDKVLYVAPFLRRQERDAGALPKFNNVFVKNLPETTTDEELKEIFGKYGSISSAVVMKEEDGKSKGFGFVNFDNPDDAAAAVEQLNGSPLLGEKSTLYVGRAQKKAEREAEFKARQQEHSSKEPVVGTNLYLKNLDDDVDDVALSNLFQPFGSIKSCKVMRDLQGHSKGSGFVSFSSPQEAQRALSAMNGKMFKNKPLYVALAEKKEDRKAKLEAQFASRGPLPLTTTGFPAPMVPATGWVEHRLPPPMYAGAFYDPRPVVRAMPHRNMYAHSAPGRPVPGFNLASSLVSAPPQHQRRMLGDALFPLVTEMQSEHAGKITGMLLEMDQTEILHLLESPDALHAKVAEANELLRQSHIFADFSGLSLHDPSHIP